MTTRAALVAALVVAGSSWGSAASAGGGGPSPPRPDLTAPSAAPDTTLDQFLGRLSDSTSAYFGISAAAPDTAGLASALAYGLVHPAPIPRVRLRPAVLPDFGFNRVDGPVYSLAARLGRERTIGELEVGGGYAAGADDGLWRARYAKLWGRPPRTWRLELEGGLETASMDPDHPIGRLNTLRAFIAGKDGDHYLRRAGFRVRSARALGFGRLSAGYRDMAESEVATSASWDLLRRDLTRFGNLAARRGRAREVELAADLELRPLPVALEVLHRTSGRGIGSDFEYRRTRVAVSGNLGLRRWAALLPQAAYGRLNGEPLPQAMFYLGGDQSMRSLPTAARGGTGCVIGRLELLGTADVLEALRAPHPAFLPIQLGAFAAAGAVWGVDPYGGPPRPGGDWPRAADWVSEVGLSLIHQPGLPDPTGLLRVSYAWPLGPTVERARLSLSYTRALDLLTRPGP